MRETYAAAEGRDGAEGAAPVAARGDLERGVRAAVQPAPVGARAAGRGEPVGQRGRPGWSASARRGWRCVRAAARRCDGRQRQQGAAVARARGSRACRRPGCAGAAPRRRRSRRSRAPRRPRAATRPARSRSARRGSRRRRRPAAARSALRSAACSSVSTESFLAASTKPQVLTITASASSGSSTRRKPPSSSRAASSSESTSLRAHPRVTRWTAVSGVAGLATGAGMTLQYDRPGPDRPTARRETGRDTRARVGPLDWTRWRSLNLVPAHICPRSPSHDRLVLARRPPARARRRQHGAHRGRVRRYALATAPRPRPTAAASRSAGTATRHGPRPRPATAEQRRAAPRPSSTRGGAAGGRGCGVGQPEDHLRRRHRRRRGRQRDGTSPSPTPARPAARCAGFPGVSYVGGGNGTQVGQAATRTDDAVKTRTLAPGKSAKAALRRTQPGNYGDDCRQTKVDGFRVYPPGSTESAFVAFTTTGLQEHERPAAPGRPRSADAGRERRSTRPDRAGTCRLSRGGGSPRRRRARRA